MRDRHKSLKRLLAVKSQLHKMEEARLEEIQRRKAALEAERRAMFDMLGHRDDPLLLGLACGRLAQTQKRESELDHEEKRQREVLLQRTAQKKALEKIVTETGRAIARDDEKRTLLDIGEALAAKAPSSLP